jgi:hypothetical protein
MGLHVFGSRYCPTSDNTVTVTAPNQPDPSRFSITESVDIGTLCVLKVHYPNATNFEGNKVMVCRGKAKDYKKLALLDPHFRPDDVTSPIARFPPDEAGWQNAIRTALLLQSGGDR